MLFLLKTSLSLNVCKWKLYTGYADQKKDSLTNNTVKSLKENLIFFKMISISHASPEIDWIKKANESNA